MSDESQAANDMRRDPRIKLPPMYTLVRVKPSGNARYSWTGYIYDISASGMRFEIDKPLNPGTELQVKALLPGSAHVTFQAVGHVVRLHDDPGTAGPNRMGLVFDHFVAEDDQKKLLGYIGDCGLKAA